MTIVLLVGVWQYGVWGANNDGGPGDLASSDTGR